jgi:hypothetical protein
MQMSKFIRLTKGLNDKGILIEPEKIREHIKDSNNDYYVSGYYYTDEQKKQFQSSGTVSGIEDVRTDKIWWDFDCKGDLEKARQDSLKLIDRLKAQNIDPNKLEIYFSGSKGFNVVLNLNKELTPKAVERLATQVFGKGLETLDVKLYNASRIIRVPKTKHQTSGLFKVPITYKMLQKAYISSIQDLAKDPESVKVKFEYGKYDLQDDLLKEVPKKENKTVASEEIDFSKRPKGWNKTKWALVQGNFGPGERNDACLIILATCRALNYDRNSAYYLAKSALKMSHAKYGEGEYSKDELWAQTERVYSDEWKGGQFSPKEDPFLKRISEKLGIKEEEKVLTIDAGELFNRTLNYITNIDELTVKTGIEELDKRIRMTVGMSVGLIAPPAAGKTSLALQILHNMAKEKHRCIFFSYDMYDALVGVKLLQKHTNYNQEQIYDLIKTDKGEFKKKLEEILKREYSTVDFCFWNGQSVKDIEDTILHVKEKSGQDVRFIVIDYNELVMTDYSDPTQSSAYVAQNIRRLAIEHNLCALSLFQPSKMSGDPSSEIKSYRSAKGSSAIEQSLSVILGVSRPGYSPNLSESGMDKFITVNGLKNRMGPIFSLDFHWDPIKGEIRKMTPQEKIQLEQMRAELKEENDKGWDN